MYLTSRRDGRTGGCRNGELIKGPRVIPRIKYARPFAPPPPEESFLHRCRTRRARWRAKNAGQTQRRSFSLSTRWTETESMRRARFFRARFSQRRWEPSCPFATRAAWRSPASDSINLPLGRTFSGYGGDAGRSINHGRVVPLENSSGEMYRWTIASRSPVMPSGVA